jgi:protein TonB
MLRGGADGRVLGCQVTESSGRQALDDATCRYYAKRARFTPALSVDGTPVESSYSDRVVWRLPEE